MKIIFLCVMLLYLCCGGGNQEQVMTEENEIPTSAGIEVTVASTDTHPAQGMLGMVVTPDITLEQVEPSEYDALVIVGGSGCMDLWDNTALHTIIQTFDSSKKTIAAICIAPVVLGRAGILTDRDAAVYPTAKDELGVCGAHYTESDVVVSGHIITCSGPQSAKDFATAILKSVSQ
jgi:protease I